MIFPLIPSLNLSDLTNAATARTNLGLEIGANVQAYDADLTTWAGITPGTGVGTALAVNVGIAGAFVTFGGDGGTPSSLTGTNITGTATGLTSGITNSLASATTTVNVSSATAPTTGQVLTATGASAATWQTPSGGGGVPTTITVADTSSATAYLGLWESAAGDLGPKTDPLFRVNASAGYLGIGGIPATQLHVISQTLVADRGIMSGQHSTDAGAAAAVFRKSRGTFASPSTTANGDYVGFFAFDAHDGTAYRRSANFGTRLDGSVSTGVAPQCFWVSTRTSDDPDPFGNGTVRLYISSAGLTGFGTTTPGAHVDAVSTSNVTIRAANSTTSGATTYGSIHVGSYDGSAVTYGTYLAETANSWSSTAYLGGRNNTSILYGTKAGGVVIDAQNASGIITLHTGGENTASERMRIGATGNVVVGHTGTALGKLESRATSGAQLAGSYDASNYWTATTGSTGITAFDAVGSAAAFTFSDAVSGASSIVSTSPTSGVGYATGAGGSVTQTTSRSTGVTINKICGMITTDSTTLATGATATFTVTNSAVAIGDVVTVSQRSGASNPKTIINISTVANGSFNITIVNTSIASSETGAIVINFAIIKAVTS